MYRVLFLFVLIVNLTSLFCSFSVMSSEFIQRVFNSKDGLINTVIRDMHFDHYGFTWLATDEGLYRVSNNFIRRIDVINSESVLAEHRLYSVDSAGDNHLLLTTEHRLYLYDIGEHTFTEVYKPTGQSADINIHSPESVAIASITTYDGNKLALLSKAGERFLFDIELKKLQPHTGKNLPSNYDWVTQLYLEDGDILYAAEKRITLISHDHQITNVDLNDSVGVIKGLLQDSQQNIWLYSTKGLFSIDLANQDVKPIEGKNFYIESMLEDSKGLLWMGSRSGLISWDPIKNQSINYQADLKLYANIDYIHALDLDLNGLLWIGGSGDGLALAATKPDFLLDSYSQSPPYELKNEMIWSIYQQDNHLWLGTDGVLEVIDLDTDISTVVTPDGIELNDSIYQMIRLDDIHFALMTTNGLFVVNNQTFETSRFSQWIGGEESLENKIVYESYRDPNNLKRIWFVTSEGIYFWDEGASNIELFTFAGNKYELDEFRVIFRDAENRLWIAGENTFGYFDQQQNYNAKNDIFGRLGLVPKIVNLTQAGPDKLWVGTSQNGLMEFDVTNEIVVDLDKKWNVDCNAPMFVQKVDNSHLIGCSNSILNVDFLTQSITAYTHKDGFISNEINEAAIFLSPSKGLYIGTPDGAMLIDPSKLVNRIENDQAFLESVSVFYEDKTDLFLIPEKLTSVKPGANLISFQISNLDYLDETAMSLQYRLLKSGDKTNNFVLLEGQSQINVTGLKAGDYTLEFNYKNRSIWSNQPVQFSFSVEEYWWQSQLFKGLILFFILFCAVSFSLYRFRQVVRFKKMNQALIESDERLYQALKGSDSDLWEWRAEDKTLYLENRGGILGKERRIACHIRDLPIHPEDLERVSQSWADLMQSKIDKIDIEYRYKHPEKQWHWLRVRGQAVSKTLEGKLIQAVGMYTDITQQKSLESEASLLAEAFENTSEGMLILDSSKRVKISNAAANNILFSTEEELNGVLFSDLIVEKNLPVDIETLLGKEYYWSGESIFARFGADNCPVRLNISMMLNSQGVTQHYVVVFSDITERKQHESNLNYLANYDILTGVANRAMFSRTLSQIIVTASQSGEKLALLFLDLDRFKHVNDSYGHSMGDALLVETAKRLQSSVGENHLVCRLGGDEFVILLRNADNVDQINAIAETVLTKIGTPFKLLGRELFVSTSIGISMWPEDATDPETLIKSADLALYHAKEEGRGNFQYYSADRNAESQYHLWIESELRTALEDNSFELFYQPQIDILQGDKFVGMEALIRWQHPRDGFIRPDIFIKVAESCGLIIDIDRWVLKQACIDGARWNNLYNEPFQLSVNVSAVQFSQTDFIDSLKSILLETGMPPKSLAIEITEGVLMKELQVAKSHLTQLKQLGIEVAIDDFGTGYSSLAYLRHFEVNTLKIDRSFLIDIATNEADQAIVSSIIELARNLKLHVVAEGIETYEQMEQVFSRGCYIIQGYYFAKPMPRKKLDAFIGLASTPASKHNEDG
ncbi:EAL domain-containing protein [Shewanella olleyana]|uniref:EAL domain-containing protein n=1 Tax=Shewanella olleyana TaxID=135626 RepID=UPI00200FFF38|nr:EAL domain-containing protein [Shewanella olleyana]MCL1068682.1 EAL domain-containing protein [Shewanella olleyana]